MKELIKNAIVSGINVHRQNDLFNRTRCVYSKANGAHLPGKLSKKSPIMFEAVYTVVPGLLLGRSFGGLQDFGLILNDHSR